MERKRLKPELNWITETKYWLEHEDEQMKNLKLGLKYVRYMKDNNLTEEQAADHFGLAKEEFHKWIHGQIPPQKLDK